MTYYAVIDTNVLVSALISARADSAVVIFAVRMLAGEIVPVYSKKIMKEYQEVPARSWSSCLV